MLTTLQKTIQFLEVHLRKPRIFQIISRWDDKVKGNYKYDLLP